MELYATIPLTNSTLRMKVSLKDVKLYSRYKWNVTTWGYAQATEKGKPIYAHKLVIFKRGHKTDHRNGDKLDNRRRNLRIATRSQNCANRAGKGRFKGVTYCPKTNSLNPWMAQIDFEKQHYHLGFYASEKAAAFAYNEKAKELHGEFACLNKVSRPRVMRRKSVLRKKTSKFKGVHYHPKNNNWVASIWFEGRSVHLGCFEKEEEAAEAHTRAAFIVWSKIQY